jgi:hypothetical protein
VLIARSDRVAVYVDRALYVQADVRTAEFSQVHRDASTFDGVSGAQPQTNSQTRTVTFAKHVCRTIEARLLDDIGEMIGPIRDLDGDNRLSIVLTHLDSRAATTETPVLGCVRDQDFQMHGNTDWAGDILYLDTRLNTDEQLTALLAHELTHAAILSMRHESSAESAFVPPWLNEAASHWVELGYSAVPIGFDQRVRQFYQSTGYCPIVADPRFVPSSIRRSGSRVSAVWFLKRFVHQPSDLQRLLRSHDAFGKIMSDLCGIPFDELFRMWSCEQSLDMLSCNDLNDYGTIRRLESGNRYTRKIFGTAFEFFEAGDQPTTVKIHSSTRARIQTTVLSR